MLNLFIFITVCAALAAACAAWILRALKKADAAPAKPRALLAGIAAACVAAFGLYIVIGKPAAADAPFALRLRAILASGESNWTAEQALAVAVARAHAYPHDSAPLAQQGEIYLAVEDAEHAVRAFDAAARREPNNVRIQLGLGVALMQMAQGAPSPDAQRAFERAASLAPNEPAPWLYMALAAMQSNDRAGAQRFWGEALKRMGPDDPRRAMAERMLRGN